LQGRPRPPARPLAPPRTSWVVWRRARRRAWPGAASRYRPREKVPKNTYLEEKNQYSLYPRTIEKRVTRTRLVVVAAGCGLAAASWLRGVQHVRKRVTAAATIPAGVCNSPARPRMHNQAETVQQHQRMADVGPG
jgi:hypothetical protein